MEQWEIDLREKLQRELPDGCYDHSVPSKEGRSIVCYSGKGGEIEVRVAIAKEIRKLKEKPIPFTLGIDLYKKMSETELREVIQEFFTQKRNDY